MIALLQLYKMIHLCSYGIHGDHTLVKSFGFSWLSSSLLHFVDSGVIHGLHNNSVHHEWNINK